MTKKCQNELKKRGEFYFEKGTIVPWRKFVVFSLLHDLTRARIGDLQ